MTEPILWQLCIGDDAVWESFKKLLARNNLKVFRIPFDEEDGVENYGLTYD